MRKFVSISLVIVALTTVWFWPNIYGQYRFKQYCEREGGLKVYGKVLPDQGWLAAGTDRRDYELPFAFKRVAFVRYQDKTGARFDVYARPRPWPKQPDFVFQPVDESKTVGYMLTNQFVRHLPNELRLSRDRYEVLSIPERRVLVSYTNFQYEQFERDRTLLAAPSGVVCEGVDKFEKFLESPFK